MSRVVVIGIDGMDYSYVRQNLSSLPNLSRLAKDAFLSKMNSVYPPDSIPSWVTIYTGKEPNEHGIIKTIDYLNKNYHQKDFNVNTSAFIGDTFWDIAGKAGKRVCVINPFMAYPVWPVNGVMVNGPVFITGENQAYPEEILKQYKNIPSLGGITDFPKKKYLQDFIDKTLEDTRELYQFSRELAMNETWDLFFVTFLTLDRVQHFLWRFTDKNDPTYPGKNPYENTILQFYKEFDCIIGKFLKLLNEEDTLLILSDHGHGMRCTRTLNLNEFLRRRGYLHSNTGKMPFLSQKYWLEKTKNFMLQLLFTLRKEEWAYHIAKLLPNPKALKTSAHVISKSGSRARLSDFAGMGPHGGISLSLDSGGAEAYENLLHEVIGELERLNNKHKGRLFKWIKPCGEVIRGKNQFGYPDILFELHDGLGVNWGLYMPLLTRNPFHRRISGGHKMEGILASNRKDFLDASKSYAVKDFKNIVVSTLGITEL